MVELELGPAGPAAGAVQAIQPADPIAEQAKAALQLQKGGEGQPRQLNAVWQGFKGIRAHRFLLRTIQHG